MSSLRCFVAVELAANVRATLAAAAGLIRESETTWRDEKWVSPDRLHVTLKFLGDLDEARLPAVESAIAGACATSRVFVTKVAAFKALPDARRCRMLWATFDDAVGEWSALAGAVSHALAPLGIAADGRPFHPHVTLVRARRTRPFDPTSFQRASAGVEPGEHSMSVVSVSLVSSRLGRGEPQYETLASWPLQG